MLTPAFELSQNNEFLIVAIQAPYAKASEVEVHFEDNDFMFFSKPYYLRLNLPGKVVFKEEPSIQYDFDKKTFTIQAPKAQIGELFEGLDLVSMLLAPKKSSAVATPLIEVLETSDDIDEECEEEFDWSIDQVAAEDTFGNLTLVGQQCGFANSYTFSVFNLKEESAEIFDVTDPKNKSPTIRTEERLQEESSRFSEDHYVADLYEDDEIQELLKYHSEWDTLLDEIQENPSLSPDDMIKFTASEKERLRKLPQKEYILDKGQKKSTFLGLIDILFAYAYNKRTTEGDNTVESAWTINKLSATLSWFEVYKTIPQVTVACIRRSLTYPLYRHFELALTILEDVRKIILLGRKYIIKCLLEIHEMFCLSEPRYILNDLFITDYIVWMQTKTCSSSKLVPLAEALEKVLLTKGDIGLNLVDIESFAKVAWMTQNTQQLSLNNERPIENDRAEDKSQPSFEQIESFRNSICSTLQRLSLVPKSKNNTERVNVERVAPVSSSSEADSSDGTDSSEYETDSNEDSDDTTSGTDSDDSTETSDSDNNVKLQLLRGASVEELD